MPPRNDESALVDGEATALLPSEAPGEPQVPRTASSRFVEELELQIPTVLPTLQSMLLTKVPWLISIFFAGQLGADALAAAALATTLWNVTGLSLSVGLSSALSTLAGQAKGDLMARLDEQKHASSHVPLGTMDLKEKKPLLTLVFLYRGLVIQLCLVIPVGLWWIFSDIASLLVALGQDEKVAVMTTSYLRVLVPGLWAYSISWTLTAWVQAIGMADVPVAAAAAGLALHVPWNIFFVHVLQWDYLGCAAATVCFQCLQPLWISIYLFVWPRGKMRTLDATGAAALGKNNLPFQEEFGIAVRSFAGIRQYLHLALPGIVIISEWWASEVSIFLSGRLGQSTLAGMSIYQSINTFCFMFPISFSVAGSMRVGNELGGGNATRARFAGNVSILCAAISSAFLGFLLMFAIPHKWLPSLFASTEPDVVEQASLTIPFLASYVFADGIQVALNGVVKGCGRQCATAPIVIVAYWVVGVPLAYCWAFQQEDSKVFFPTGIRGLVGGMTVGTWVHMLLLAALVFGKIRWKEEAILAKERLRHH